MSRTTDKYIKVRKPSETAPQNEIRIRAIPQIGRYITYAATLLRDKKEDSVIIKASGNAVKSACQIAEILRHRILNLHQLTTLKTISVIDEYLPKEEGLDRVVVERKLAVLEICLSLNPNAFDTKAPGYQAPLPAEQVQEEELNNVLQRRGGSRGRGGPRNQGDRPPREEGEGDRPPREGGRGRGGRGRGRGRGYEGGRSVGYEGGRTGGYEGRRTGGYEGGRTGGYEGRRTGGYEGGRSYEGGRTGGYEGGRTGGYEGGRTGGQEGGRGGYRSRGGRSKD